MSGIPAFAEQFEIFSTGDESGFTAQIPLVEIDDVNWVGALRNTALVQAFTDQPHPEVGSGALWLLRLPRHIEKSAVVVLSNQLNLMESRGDAP